VEDVSLEIQAYDELCLPPLAAEWAEQSARRPFVGALTLELPADADDDVLAWIWAAGVQRLKVGSGREFSATTQESLVADLRSILAPEHVARAREVATHMTTPAESVAGAADLLEDAARLGA
jgi:UDP:flavonoid glycosyltransferase YjiC (YdhE family)